MGLGEPTDRPCLAVCQAATNSTYEYTQNNEEADKGKGKRKRKRRGTPQE